MAIPVKMDDMSIIANNNTPAGSESPTVADDYLRAIQAVVRTTNAQGADIISAATTDIGAATGEFVNVTGTTTITALGTIGAGVVREVVFTGALTLTHNAVSLILPTAVNITTVAGDVGRFRSLGSGNWKCTFYSSLSKTGGNVTGGLNLARASIVQNATTMDLFALSNTIDGTGSAIVITAIVNAPQAGARRFFYPIVGTTITNNAMFNVDGAANYVSLAGDQFEFEAKTISTYNVHITLAAGNTNVVNLTTNQTIAGVKTFSSQPIVPTQSMIRLNTSNGYGSTNTVIPRFTNIGVTQGADITYADSATLGASLTINTAGVYGISYSANLASLAITGVSLNSSQLTTSIITINVNDRLVQTQSFTAGASVSCSVTLFLAAGSVIRPHSDAAVLTNPALHNFTITRVS